VAPGTLPEYGFGVDTSREGGSSTAPTGARRLLVGHDGSPESSDALAEAARLARAAHGRMTVVLAHSHAPQCAVLGPVSVITLDRDVREAAERELARAVRAIDPHVSVTYLQTACSLGRTLVKLWRRGEHDAVVLAQPALLGARRLALWRLRRARVEPLLVHPPMSAPDRPRSLRRRRPARRARPA